jgi:hypothetical protein
MDIKRTAWLMGAVGMLILIFIPCAFGQKEGSFRDQFYGFHPYIDLEGTWDDNINLTQDNRIGDFITTISPGLMYRSKGPGYDFDLGFELGLNSYATHTENNYVGYDGRFTGFYDIDRRWTVRLHEDLTRSRDGLETYTITNSAGQQITSAANPNSTLYWRNIFEPSVEYKFGRENLVSFQYRNNVYRPESNNFGYGNSTENAFSPHLAYWFDIRNGITLDYTYSIGTFENQSNYVSNFIVGSYIYRFSPKTKVFGNFRYEIKNFDPPGIDYSVYSPTVGLEYAFSATLTGRAEFGWFWQAVDIGPPLDGPAYTFSITQKGPRTTYTLAFQGGYREQYFTTENLGISQYNQIMARVNHKLWERLSLTFMGNLGQDVFENPSRTDNSYGLTGILAYQPLKWLTFSLEGGSYARQSDLNGDSYRDNRGILRLTAVY